MLAILPLECSYCLFRVLLSQHVFIPDSCLDLVTATCIAHYTRLAGLPGFDHLGDLILLECPIFGFVNEYITAQLFHLDNWLIIFWATTLAANLSYSSP